MIKGYYYELKCVDEDKGTLVSYKFPADTNVDDMRYSLRDFLAGCSWPEEQINEILGEE